METQKPTFNDWFWINLKIGALSFGSSGRLMLYEDEVVTQRKWLSREEFQESLTIAQVLPGPSLVNLAYYLGRQLIGHGAALWGMLALVIPGSILIVLLALFVNIENPMVRKLFQGFSLASVSIFLIFLIRQFSNFKSGDPKRIKFLSRLFAATAIGAASLWGMPLLWILLVGGGSCFLIEFLLP